MFPRFIVHNKKWKHVNVKLGVLCHKLANERSWFDAYVEPVLCLCEALLCFWFWDHHPAMTRTENYRNIV